MNNDNQKDNKTNHLSGVVHVLLSQDYAIFFFAVILGVICDALFSVRVLGGAIYQNIGFLFIIIGTIIIYWSQSTTRKMSKMVTQNRDLNFFLQGPYRYTRNPTNFALTLLILGLGLLVNSIFLVIFILITYVISRVFFIKKQDAILKERYGNVFLEYTRKVKDWI